MSDARLRELERAFAESGSEEDETAFLLERVRAGEKLDWDQYRRLAELHVCAAAAYLLARVAQGELAQNRLELAGQVGCAGAELALGSAGTHSIGERLLNLGSLGHSVSVRAAHAAASKVLPLWRERLGDDDRPLETSEFVADWIVCPCEDHLAHVLVQAGNAEVAGNGVSDPDQVAAWAVAESAYAMTSSTTALARALVFSVAALSGSSDWRDHLPASFLDRESEASRQVLTALAEDLVPWALGYGDPVRDRVEARQREAAGG